MKKILKISQLGGLTTFSWTASLFLFSHRVVQPFKFFVRLAAHVVNFVNDFQMFLHVGLMKLDAKIKATRTNHKHNDLN